MVTCMMVEELLSDCMEEQSYVRTVLQVVLVDECCGAA